MANDKDYESPSHLATRSCCIKKRGMDRINLWVVSQWHWKQPWVNDQQVIQTMSMTMTYQGVNDFIKFQYAALMETELPAAAPSTEISMVARQGRNQIFEGAKSSWMQNWGHQWIMRSNGSMQVTGVGWLKAREWLNNTSQNHLSGSRPQPRTERRPLVATSCNVPEIEMRHWNFVKVTDMIAGYPSGIVSKHEL